MERYNKYLVLKIADIEKYLSDEKQLKLDALVTCIRVGRLNDGKRDQEYVCVAADWPMHEQVWGMVEAFVDGKPNEIEQLTARVRELEEENARLTEWEQAVICECMACDACLDCSDPRKTVKNIREYYFTWGMEEQKTVIETGLITELREQLAAEQLNNKLLRNALEFFFSDWKTYDHLSWKYKAKEALSLPASTEALDAYVEQKIKEYK